MVRSVVLLVAGLVALPVRADEAGGDFEAAWAAASRRFPALGRYRPIPEDPAPIDRLLAWAGAGGRTTVYDERCRPIRVERDGNTLSGSRISRVTVRGSRRIVESYGVSFGNERSIDGPGTTTYRPGRNGRWIEDGGGGCGCVEYPKGELAKVTRDRAWYGRGVSLSVKCNAWSGVERPCADGSGPRTCTRCVGVGIEASGDGFLSASGSLSQGVVRESEPDDCSIACPEDDGKALLERLDKVLGDRRFLDPGSPLGRPDLYRTLEACTQDRDAREKRRTKR